MARKAAKPTSKNKEFFEAIAMLEQERGIPADYLLEKVCSAIITSVRKEYGGEDVVFVDCNPEKSELRVYLRKTVVEVVENEFTELLPEEAKKYVDVGSMVTFSTPFERFGEEKAFMIGKAIESRLGCAALIELLRMLKSGMVLAIEPMICQGRRQVLLEDDGWTARTIDRKPAAHYELSVCVRNGKADILSTFDYIQQVLGDRFI